MLRPFPSSLYAPSIWYAAEAVPHIKFFGNDIELNFGYSITDIIAKILKLPKETEIPLEADGDEIYKITQQDDFVSYDWLINTIYDYFDDEINLEETIKYLLEE